MNEYKEKLKKDFETFLQGKDDEYLQKIFKQENEEYYIEKAMNKIQELQIIDQRERMNVRRIIALLEKDPEEAIREIEEIIINYDSPSDSEPDEPQGWNTTERWTKIKELIRQNVNNLKKKNDQLKLLGEQNEFLLEENYDQKIILQTATTEIQQHLGKNEDQSQYENLLQYFIQLKEGIGGVYLFQFMVSLIPNIPEDWTSDEEEINEETL